VSSAAFAAAFVTPANTLDFCAEHLTKGKELQPNDTSVFSGYSIFKTEKTNIDSKTGYALKVTHVMPRGRGLVIYWVPVDFEFLKAHPNDETKIEDVEARGFTKMEGAVDLAIVDDGKVGEVELTVTMKLFRGKPVYEMSYTNFIPK
jgi:hypothetical protein